MNVVVTLAGHGRRFEKAGYSLPKPLITVHGKPMYAFVTECLPLDLARTLIFVGLADHDRNYGLRDDIRQRFGGFPTRTVLLEKPTSGQACSVLSAAESLHLNQPLLIHNADTWFEDDFAGRLSKYPSMDGCLGVFHGVGDHWSFARVDESGRVTETAEKRRISKWASTGLYYFRSTRRFLEMAGKACQSVAHGQESFIAPLYNEIISTGSEVRVSEAASVIPLGTPAELERFQQVFSKRS